jgi:hypothetical protein
LITTVDAFPDDARVTTCEASCADLREPLAVSPATGEVFRMRSGPPGLDLDRAGPGAEVYPIRGVYVAPDGAIWAVIAPSTGPEIVVRSVDRGASWQQSQPPDRSRFVAVAARDAREAYALIALVPEAGAPTQTRLLRTDDGGTTWVEVPTNLPRGDYGQTFTVTVDGDLVVAENTNTEARIWISRDGGVHFTAEPAIPGGSLRSAPGRVWTDAGRTPGPARVTEDGEHWRTFPLPRR